MLVENSVSGGEVKADHEGESSAAPVLSAEKWSHEAIVARSKYLPLSEKNRAIAAYTKALEFRNGKSFRRVTEKGDSCM
ncbi:hypothetical protein LC608_33205 [Nostoc sp. XA010]|uniref:hypothetical protein n=1 Tax=Nostoc sp. XA010 TaxID=2780407 RepID=UPI001E40C4D5|nr:hypothetical protein [Nostoc sp. XA010]MCC5661719.1 hypothetical protein [Nostoc sp. XA010]